MQEKLTIGAYNNSTTFFNPYDFTVKSKDFSMEEDQVGKVKSAGKDIAFVAKEFRAGPTRGMSAILDMGTLPVGVGATEQVENWKKDRENLNDKVRERMSQAVTRYNQIFSVSVDVLIEGDFSLKAGDTIFIKKGLEHMGISSTVPRICLSCGMRGYVPSNEVTYHFN